MSRPLVRALVAAYPRHVHERLGRRGWPPPEGLDQAMARGERWLERELETLLELPFERQPRGPLEVFQEAMRFPTEALAAAGQAPVARDPAVESALPGDVYDLAPASSREIGEEVWRLHVEWGLAKARSLRGPAPPDSAPAAVFREGSRLDRMDHSTVVPVGRARIPVYEAGQGPLALLIHGYPLDHRCWLDQIRDLGSDDRRVAAVDLRGHGASPWAGDPVHTMDLLADDVAAVIEEISPDGKADVAGLSMGGYVVLGLLERHAERIRSVALVCSRAVADTAQGREGRDAMATSAVNEGRGWLANRLLPNLVAPGSSILSKARVRSMIEDQPLETIVADLAGMRDRPDRTEVLEGIEVPLVMIHGSEDSLIPPAESEAMAASVAGARLAIVPGSGHMAPVERPDVVAQALQDVWRAAAG